MAFFNKIVDGLKKTRKDFLGKLNALFGTAKKFDDEFFDRLEEILIMSDVGTVASMEIVSNVKKKCRENKCRDISELKGIFVEEIMNIFNDNNERENAFVLKSPAIILMVGVNGAGKTTSIGKLGNLFKNQGKKVMLVAGDTFRAAAVEQLEIWANKINVPIISNKEGSDPGAVIYDAIKSAKTKKIDILICDTAGRLQNKINLMNELKKIFKIIDREFSEAQLEVFISIDATMGQNAIQQARLFNESCDLTGIVLTKLDSSARGGMVIPIVKELKIPVRFVGVGEKEGDIQEFDYKNFAFALFSESEKINNDNDDNNNNSDADHIENTDDTDEEG